MTTLLITHPACTGHDTAPGHPECAARLRAVLTALGTETFERLVRREAPAATVPELARVHPEPYVRAILAGVPSEGYARFDADTIVSPGSGEAALRAAGAARAAGDAVGDGGVRNARSEEHTSELQSLM